MGDLNAAVEPVDVVREKVEVVDKFTYLGSVVHTSNSSEAELARPFGLSHGALN